MMSDVAIEPREQRAVQVGEQRAREHGGKQTEHDDGQPVFRCDIPEHPVHRGGQPLTSCPRL